MICDVILFFYFLILLVHKLILSSFYRVLERNQSCGCSNGDNSRLLVEVCPGSRNVVDEHDHRQKAPAQHCLLLPAEASLSASLSSSRRHLAYCNMHEEVNFQKKSKKNKKKKRSDTFGVPQ